jgi:pimeloyl-ACP methyl ester carboxylesterase
MSDPNLHVVEHCSDDPDAPLVVLVHGVLDSSLSFDGVVDALVPDFTVVTYDRRGWGRSADAAPARSLADHADDLVSVMRERRGTIVGHSYGGAVAMLTAVRRPDLVAALGLFEPSMQWLDWWPPMDTIAEQAPDEQEHFRAGLEGRPRPTPEQRARDQALLAQELTFIADPPLAFGDIAAPRLVGRGGLSNPWRVAVTDRLHEELSCGLVVIDDAGHTAHRMQPKEFADFARRVAALREDAG